MPCSTLTTMRSSGTRASQLRILTARAAISSSAVLVAGQADFQFLGHRLDALDPPRRALGREFLDEAVAWPDSVTTPSRTLMPICAASTLGSNSISSITRCCKTKSSFMTISFRNSPRAGGEWQEHRESPERRH